MKTRIGAQITRMIAFLLIALASFIGISSRIDAQQSLRFSPEDLPNAQYGVPYSQYIIVSGANIPYTFEITDGTLPPGLRARQVYPTGESLPSFAIFGTPEKIADILQDGRSYSFTVRVTDGNEFSVSHEYSVNIEIALEDIREGLQPNGCGGAGSLINPPDDYALFDFTIACNLHDTCYGSLTMDKDSCDEKFLDDMAAECPPVLVGCELAAEIYYYFVVLRGQEYYDTAQFVANQERIEIALQLQNQALLAFGQGNYSEAIDYYVAALDYDIDSEYVYYLMGNVYYVAGEEDNALSNYSEAIKLDPVNPIFYSARGDLYAQLGDTDAAIADYQRYVDLVGEANAVPEIIQYLESNESNLAITYAEVYVEDPTGLRVRSGPGVDNAEVESLFTGDIVEIIGGPVDASGYTWWNIRTPSGAEGWSVEAAGGIQTLNFLAAPQAAITARLTIPLETDHVYNIAWSPDDSLIAVASLFGAQLWIYNTETATMLYNVEIAPPETLRWSEDGSYIEVSGIDGTQVFNVYLGQPVAENRDPSGVVWIEQAEARSRSACLSTGDNLDTLVIEGDSGTLHAGNPAGIVGPGGAIQLGNGGGGVAWLSGSSRVVIWSLVQTEYGSDGATSSGTAEVWDLDTASLVARVPHGSTNYSACGEASYRAALSSDETQIAAVLSGIPTAELTLWQIEGEDAADTDESEAAAESSGEAVVTCAAILPENGNIRSGPDTSFERIGIAVGSTTVTLDGQTTTNGFVWYHLETDGWLREDVVTADADCANLPQRN